MKIRTVTQPFWGALKLIIKARPAPGLKTFTLRTADSSAVAVGNGVRVMVKVGVIVKVGLMLGLGVKVRVSVAVTV